MSACLPWVFYLRLGFCLIVVFLDYRVCRLIYGLYWCSWQKGLKMPANVGKGKGQNARYQIVSLGISAAG